MRVSVRKATGRIAVTAALAMVWLVSPVVAQPASSLAGRVKSAAGPASIVRAGQTLPADVGVTLLSGDVLRTGLEGRVSVMLQDDTRLSLGPASEVALSEFQFVPAESRLALVLRVVQGVVSYVSGRIAILAPGSVRIESPTLIIGVRGTHALIRVDAP